MARTHIPGRRVLILEDDVELAQATEALLATVGFSMQAEKTAEAARISFDRCFPDVLITDIRLNGEDGLSFLTWAKEQARMAGRDLHAIVISGQADPDTGRHAIDAGADRFYRKPFDPAAVISDVVAATRTAPVGPNLSRAFVDGSRIDSLVRHL